MHVQRNGDEGNGVDHCNSDSTSTAAIDIHKVPNGLSYLPLAGQPLAELEREAIRQTLNLHNGNRKLSAAILGISVRTLQRKIKEWNTV